MMEEETICLQCGDGRFTNAFVYCVKCLKFAVHRYCLDVMPETYDEYVRWVCDDCEAKIQSRFYLRKPRNSPSPTRDHKVLKNIKLCSEKEVEENDLVIVQIDNEEPIYEEPEEENLDKVEAIPMDEIQIDNEEPIYEEPEEEKVEKVEATPMDEIEPEPEELRATSHKKLIKKRRRRIRYTMRKRKRRRNVVGKLSTEKEAQQSNVEKQSDQTCISRQRSDSDDMSIRENRETEDKEDDVFATCRSSNILDVSFGKPVLDPVWRGSFGISNKEYDKLDDVLAHISSKACQKVFEAASQFRPCLQFEMLPKSEIWPKSFEKSNPSGDNIALYFFPSNKSERFYDSLVERMTGEELGLKTVVPVVQNVELLIFTSVELPLVYWRFQSKYYLWAVFRESLH